MPTKKLPPNPSLRHLKNQARDLLKNYREQSIVACQQIREFHPRFIQLTDDLIRAQTFTLSDAQLTVAREYGFSSWTRLRTFIEKEDPASLSLPHHERIENTVFRQAVDLIDEGNLEDLGKHLSMHPDLVHERIVFEGGNYFTEPSLLEFCAENPIRHNRLPENIIEITTEILERGAKSDQQSVNSLLQLVCSGRIPRECGVQVSFVDLLCDYGADPDYATQAAIGHGEFAAVEALIRRGAAVNLAIAAATGNLDTARTLLANANAESRHHALAQAVQHGRSKLVLLLLDSGEDPNRFNPVGSHSHSTPLHQAAIAGHLEVVKILIESGARIDIGDVHHQATPLAWAKHAGHTDVVEYLQAIAKNANP